MGKGVDFGLFKLFKGEEKQKFRVERHPVHEDNVDDYGKHLKAKGHRDSIFIGKYRILFPINYKELSLIDKDGKDYYGGLNNPRRQKRILITLLLISIVVQLIQWAINLS